MQPKVYQFLVGVFASLGSALFGYDLGVIAGVIGSTDYKDRFSPTKAQDGAVVATFTAGAFIGAGLAGPSGDRFGRRLTIMTGAIIFLVGGALQTAAQSLEYLYVGRLIAGIGVGFLTMIIRKPTAICNKPVYQSEIVHPSIRGRVTGLQQFMLGIGALIASWTTYGTHIGLSDSAQWRVPLGIQMLPAAILAPLILLFPESPRWLIDHNRADQGLKSLARLHAGGDTSDAWVQAEYAQIQEAISFEHDHEAKSYKELFRNRSSFRRLVIACALQAATQMTGVSAIQYFSPQIFEQIGISTDNTLKYQAISSVLALIAQAACMATIDKFGRRWVVINGMLFNGLMFIIATILIAKFPPDTNSSGTAGWGFIIVTWLYNVSFSYATGPLSWIIPAEIFDTHTRSKGVSIATMTSFAFNTMIGQCTSVAMENVGWRFFLLFVVCNFTNALFFYLVLPETKKLPLEEMNYLFTNAPWIVPGTDKASYSAGLAADIERRAAEVREKGAAHHEVEQVN